MTKNKLESIDTILTKQLILLEKEVLELKFVKKFEFILDENFDIDLLKKIEHKGIYLVEIKTDNSFSNIQKWISAFLEKWEDEKFKKRFVPNSRKTRVEKHTKFKTWFPIYIGRSKKISSRIKMHVFKELHKPTGALKLLERKNLYGNKFRVSTIEVNVKNYDLIMPQIEKYFRNKINPILGRQ